VTTPPEPPAEPDAPKDAGLDQRVTSLESKIDRILGLFDGSEDPGDGGQPAGAPNIAHEIRQQLDERDAKAKADAEKQQVADELGQVKAKVAELAEKPPAPMPRKVERLMGWR
jgi:hypothetical protein